MSSGLDCVECGSYVSLESTAKVRLCHACAVARIEDEESRWQAIDDAAEADQDR